MSTPTKHAAATQIGEAVDPISVDIHNTDDRPRSMARLELARVQDPLTSTTFPVTIDAHSVTSHYDAAHGRKYYFEWDLKTKHALVALLFQVLYAILLLFRANDPLFDTQMSIIGVAILIIILSILSWRIAHFLTFFGALLNFIAQVVVYVLVCLSFNTWDTLLLGLVTVGAAYSLLACAANIIDAYLLSWESDTFIAQLAEEFPGSSSTKSQDIGSTNAASPNVTYSNIGGMMADQIPEEYTKQVSRIGSWFSNRWNTTRGGGEGSMGQKTEHQE